MNKDRKSKGFTVLTIKKIMGAISGIAVAGLMTAGTMSTANAQATISEGEIINSLASGGAAAQASGLDLNSLRAEVEKRIQVEGTENAASPPPVLQALANLPNLTIEINFEFNSDWVKPVSWPTIGTMADALHHPLLLGNRFLVVGHTDAKGSRKYNLDLSQRRADSVREILISSLNIPPERLIAIGLGEEQLRLPNDPNNALNRRVQLLNLGP